VLSFRSGERDHSIALGTAVVTNSGKYPGVFVVLALGLLATGVAAGAIWSRAVAAPEHGAQVRTGIICGTPSGDCVIPAQPVGASCACPLGARVGGSGVVLPDTAARGG
jgi:hypothetical protein